MINVLVFPCGSEIGLEVNEALKRDKHIKLYGLSSVPCHGSFVYENYIEGISFINSSSFMSELNDVIKEHNIDVLIPSYDDVILFLSDKREDLHCKLVTSSKETCEIARSKKKTYASLRNYDFTPKTYDIDDISIDDLPLFAKPDIGQGSQGAFRVETLEDLEIIKKTDEDYVICEMLPGEEYTVDAFTNIEGRIISLSMRKRVRTRNGISVNTISSPLPDKVKEIAESINKEIKMSGVWFFQVKIDKGGNYKLLEIAPRVAGSMSLSRVRGFNYILNAVYQAMGYEVKSLPHTIDMVEEDRALSNEYKLGIKYSTAYIDLDDTIIIGDKVNTELIQFLYQCQNNKVTLKLISRHATIEQETLKKYNIDVNLFKEIIHVEEPEKKSKYIREKDAILIDDSFRERYDVSKEKGIPVFDLDGVAALIER